MFVAEHKEANNLKNYLNDIISKMILPNKPHKNDPYAGSPTKTLLRLLLPLSDKVYLTSRTSLEDSHSPEGSPDHSKSVGATGGVYKGQGRNQYKMMTCTY